MNRYAAPLLAVSLFAGSPVLADAPREGTGVDLPIGFDGKRAPYEECIKDLNQTDYQSVRELSDASSLSLDELREGNLRWNESVRSLKVEFAYEFKRFLETTKDLEAKKAGRLVPSGLSYRVVYATKGSKVYKSYTDLTRDASGRGVDASSEPLLVQAYDGDRMRQFEARSRTAVLQEAKMAGMDNNANMYLEAIFCPSGENADDVRKTDWYVPVALGLGKFYRVRPRLDEVDGHPCHVATSGWDTIWIDHENSFIVRRRVHFARTSASDPGCLQYLQICQDFVDAGGGVPMPRECVRLDYCTHEEPDNLRGKLRAANSVTADVRTNNVPDDLFVLAFPPGTLVQDLIEKKAYKMPGGEELLDRAIAEAVPIKDGRVVGMPGPTHRPRHTRTLTIWVVGAGLALLMAAIVIRRVRRRRLPEG